MNSAKLWQQIHRKKRHQDSVVKALRHFGAIKDRLGHPTGPSILTPGRKKSLTVSTLIFGVRLFWAGCSQHQQMLHPTNPVLWNPQAEWPPSAWGAHGADKCPPQWAALCVCVRKIQTCVSTTPALIHGEAQAPISIQSEGSRMQSLALDWSQKLFFSLSLQNQQYICSDNLKHSRPYRLYYHLMSRNTLPSAKTHSRRDIDLSPAVSSTVSMGLIHPKQDLSAGFTNLCSVLSIQGEMQCCAAHRRIMGMKRKWCFKPEGGESAVKLHGKPAQTSRGEELPGDPLARAALSAAPGSEH